MICGVLLIVVGAVALAVKSGIISGSIWGFTWPIILIVLGVSLLYRRRRWGVLWGPGCWWWGEKGEGGERHRE
jgi:hypothetical protein